MYNNDGTETQGEFIFLEVSKSNVLQFFKNRHSFNLILKIKSENITH